MEARVAKPARVSARFSKSLGDAGFVRTRKRCAWHPTAPRDDKALHVVAALDDLHAQQRCLCYRSFNLPRVVAAVGPDQFGQGKRLRILLRTSPAPSRSWIAAEWATTRIGSPSLSTRAWVLQALTCCRRRNPRGRPTVLLRLHRCSPSSR